MSSIRDKLSLTPSLIPFTVIKYIFVFTKLTSLTKLTHSLILFTVIKIFLDKKKGYQSSPDFQTKLT
jgi:hypothetical protein